MLEGIVGFSSIAVYISIEVEKIVQLGFFADSTGVPDLAEFGLPCVRIDGRGAGYGGSGWIGLSIGFLTRRRWMASSIFFWASTQMERVVPRDRRLVSGAAARFRRQEQSASACIRSFWVGRLDFLRRWSEQRGAGRLRDPQWA